MTTVINLFKTWPKQFYSGFFLWCTQDAVLLAPKDLQGLIGKGVAATGKAATAGKGGERLCPSSHPEVRRGNFKFCVPDAAFGIRKSLAAEAAADAWSSQEPHPQSVEHGWERHRLAIESGRREKQ
jgi:hypothetical protein